MNPYQITAFAFLACITGAAIIFVAGAATVRIMDWLDRRRVRYRYLKDGEVIRQGDEWRWQGGTWIKSVRIGAIVQDAGKSAFTYRRPLNQEGNK